MTLSARDDPWYSVLSFDGDASVTEPRPGERATEPTLTRVSHTEAVEHAAVPPDRQSDEVHEAVETGSVTGYNGYVDEFQRDQTIEHDGKYCYDTRLQYRGGQTLSGPTLVGVWVTLFALGSALPAYSGWRSRAIAV